MIIYKLGSHEKNDLPPSSFLQINACGILAPEEKVTCFRPGGRSDWQLIYVLSGRFEVEYQNVCHRVTQGFILYPPRMPQRYTYLQAKCIFVHFTGHNVQEILQDTQLECGVHPVTYSPIIHDLLVQLIAEHSQTGLVSSEKGLFLYILYLLKKQCNITGSNSEAIQDVIKFSATNFRNKLRVDKLATSCKLCTSRFMHLFKEETGMSPLAYQQSLRIGQAKVFLASTNLSVSEIAAEVGYQDPLYFSRVFKKATGVSPKVYRQSCSQGE